jgi:hypothetical protein
VIENGVEMETEVRIKDKLTGAISAPHHTSHPQIKAHIKTNIGVCLIFLEV